MKMDLPENEHSLYHMLPKKVCSFARSLKNQLERSLPNNVKPNIIFTGTKPSPNFNVKDTVSSTEKHDVTYKSVCPTENYKEDYAGEFAKRLYERGKFIRVVIIRLI